MSNSEYNESIRTGELQLSRRDKWVHFGIVPYLLIVPLMLILFHLVNLSDGLSKVRDGEIYFLIVPTIFAGLSYRLQKNRLKFKIISSVKTIGELYAIISKAGHEEGWIISQHSKHIYIAESNPSFWSGSWGEQITVLFENNRIYVNSICSLNKRNSIVSFGRNRQNVQLLVDKISEVEGHPSTTES